MTTTLRPSGPEETTSGGGRRRAFDIRVNGRRVGGLSLAVPGSGAAGRISDLRISGGERRRGRATVAVLAAEEALRVWGCREAAAAVPAAAGPALALATSLGYAERHRYLVKELIREPPALPPGVTARPLRDAEYPGWLAGEQARYVRALADRGIAPEHVAAARVEADHARLLPRGPATGGTALRVLVHEGAGVGTLWLSTAAARLPHGVDAYVMSVTVAETLRGRGYGRALMTEAERLARAGGAGLIGLNVFTDNTPARRLYASLGYAAEEYHLYKSLG
jgi:ribosomal protein S18 acetylase RimI-like enzyme